VAVDLETDDLLLDPLLADPRERLPAHEIGVAVQVDEPVQPQLERVVLVGHVGTPVEYASLDPADVDRAGRADLVRGSRLHDPFPQIRSARGVEQIDLVPDLRGPARA